MMGTGLEGNVQVGPPGITRIAQSLSLRVWTAKAAVEAAADDAPSTGHDSPDEGVRRNTLQAPEGKLERLSHE